MRGEGEVEEEKVNVNRLDEYSADGRNIEKILMIN